MCEQGVERPTGERCALAQRTLEGLLERMGFAGSVESSEDEERIQLRIFGTDASALIGKKGRTLDALQFIVNKMVGREPGERKLVVIDSDNYRQRREASLVQLAERLSKKAVEEGKIVKLNPMSARDRRVIHMTLRDTAGVSTHSEGEGDDRRLLIVPE